MQHNKDDLNFIWANLPTNRKRVERDYEVLIRREGGKDVWVALRSVTSFEFCLLRATAKAQESNKRQILKHQMGRK